MINLITHHEKVVGLVLRDLNTYAVLALRLIDCICASCDFFCSVGTKSAPRPKGAMTTRAVLRDGRFFRVFVWFRIIRSIIVRILIFVNRTRYPSVSLFIFMSLFLLVFFCNLNILKTRSIRPRDTGSRHSCEMEIFTEHRRRGPGKLNDV